MIDVLLGLQWGDEGKGKIVDYLATSYDIIARFQGGPNAGHTLYVNGQKVVLHTIPSGVFHSHCLNLIGNGVVIDPVTLKKEIDSLQKLNQQLSDDAKSLATALKGDVKIQGNWGEDRLLTILEAEGLQEHIDYGKEVSVNDEEWKRQRPDFVVNIPGGRCLVIDSKVSLTAYAAYFNAESIEVKKQALQEHLKSVKNHIELLSGKNYQSIFGAKSPDYTFLFMPIEGALTLALNEDPSLFESAMKKQIVLVTPHPQLNLSKTLESMDVIWVEGELKETRTKTASGVSGYSLEAIKVYPYKALHNTNK